MPPPRSPGDLFVAFALLGLQGFGGVMVAAQRVLCEERQWLTRAEFLELLSVCQAAPGPNVCNVSLMVGDRFFGWRGAAAALGGLVAVPFFLVLALASAYTRWSGYPAVAGALRGMGAVAAGLIAATAIKLAQGLRTSPLGVPACAALAGAVFVLMALVRVPLVWTLAALAPPACLLGWRRTGARP